MRLLDLIHDLNRVAVLPYVNNTINAPTAPVGGRFNGRLYRSCESVEATCRLPTGHFEAFPSVCHQPELCERVGQCRREALRWSVVNTALLAVIEARSSTWAPPIAR